MPHTEEDGDLASWVFSRLFRGSLWLEDMLDGKLSREIEKTLSGVVIALLEEASLAEHGGPNTARTLMKCLYRILEGPSSHLYRASSRPY